MEKEVLTEIIASHKKWLYGGGEGKKADLCGANLRGANLRGANLREADLYGADLCGANLREADLCGANLREADLRGADLCGANLYGADLHGADLYGANLYGANLYGADLHGANLYGADLCGANLREADLRGADLCGANLYGADLYGAKNNPYIPMACPDTGAFIGWKKASGLIVKLEILEDSRRSSATGRKCRCDKAKVIAIENPDGTTSDKKMVSSDRDSEFIYRVGEIIEEPAFCTDRFKECAEGIHFFINRQEAVEWNPYI